MKDIAQIQLIKKSLGKERDQTLFELNHINTMLTKKFQIIQKMRDYQNEYMSGNNLVLSKTIPMLHKNLNSFTQKLKDIVLREEQDIQKLQVSKNTKLQKINSLEQKMKLMEQFIEKVLVERTQVIEKVEQATLDDLSALKHARGTYE